MSGRWRILFLLMSTTAAGCVARSHGTLIASPPSATRPTHPTTQPILYHRTGGIAGTDDRVVIWPDGLVQVSGKILPSATAHLSDERLQRLVKLFRGWNRLRDAYLADVNDAYTIEIFFGDKSVTALDLAPDLPEQFRAIYTEIEAIAADASKADAKPAGEP